MSEFNVSGRWNAQQSNGFVVHFDIEQTNTKLRGIGSHTGGSVNGTGEGSVQGNQFVFTVRWSNGSVGEYNGTFNNLGRITGFTFDQNHPDHQATWVSLKTFQQA